MSTRERSPGGGELGYSSGVFKAVACGGCQWMMIESEGQPSAGVPRMKLTLLLILGLSAGVWTRSVPEDGSRKPFAVEDVIYKKFKGFAANWISDTLLEYKSNTTGDIMTYDMKDTVSLVKGSVLKKYNSTWYKFSSDNKYLLMRYNATGRYRHSTTANYVVYSLLDGSYTDVGKKAFLQCVEWVPGRHALVYVKENNIYYSELGSGGKNYPVTESGIPGLVFNGIPDWVYEEDVLKDGSAFSISPDGGLMVYLTIDDREVHMARFMEYGEPGSLKDQYDSEVSIPYPKPGTTIPKYQVKYFNFTDRSMGVLENGLFPSGREIVFGWNWITNTTVALVYANRVQNVTVTDVCPIPGVCKTVYEDRNPKGWANFDVPLISRTEDRYLVRVRQMVGKVEYYHVNLIYKNGSRVALTNGTFMVRAIVDWDQKSRFVYYRASDPGRPSSTHVYVVSETGKDQPFCLTCQMTSSDGSKCLSGNVEFNSGFRYFIGTCKGPGPAVVSVYTWSAPSGMALHRSLYDSWPLREFLKERVMPVAVDASVKVTDSMEADIRLLLPPGLDTSGKTKYPLVIYVYGGPDTAQVDDQFSLDWSLYLTTNRSIICAVIDGRGSGRKGTEMMYAVYRALGTVEIEDQITGAKYLRSKYPFIDPNRIGIWGWSYGGYATTKVLEDDADGIFKCGVAVAPVSDWIYYNSVYTERYMDLPKNNEKGYRKSSTLYNVKNLRNKKYLLMHGTGDDNVHYQHAMQLAKVLERNNIMFEQEAYPDEAHSISGLLLHVYYTMDRFWGRCFGLSS